MKYSSFSTRTLFAVVVSLAFQPLAITMDTPVVSVTPAASAATNGEASVFLQATYGVGKVAKSALNGICGVAMWALKGVLKKVADKSDLLAENHPVICAALVASGCYGIYSLYQKLICYGSQRKKRGQDGERVLLVRQ